MPPIETSVAVPKKLMTADEFWVYANLPENEPRNIDLIQGEVVEMSRPTRIHGRVCFRVTYLLENWVEKVRNGYIATNDAGVVLEEDPDTVVGPDVAYYTDANTFDEVPPKWGDVPPILAVEVSSPNDRMGKVNAKIMAYLRNGVRLVWLVDSEERIVTIYRPQQQMVILRDSATITGEDVLPGFSCKVSDFFYVVGDSNPPPPPPSV